MRKCSLIVWLVMVQCLLCSALCNAQGKEKITIATYFPSPYGAFIELESNVVYMNPQDPAPCKREGDVMYDKKFHRLKVCNGTEWKVVGGELKTQTVTCNASYMYVPSSVNDYGCTATCPAGWHVLGGGHEFTNVASRFGRYSIQEGNGWHCLINVECPQYPPGTNWARGTNCGQGITCYAVCGKIE